MQVYVQGLRHVRRKEIEEEVDGEREREREGVNHSFRANCAPADPSAASLPPTIPEKSRPIVYVRLQALLRSLLSRWRPGKHPNHSGIVAEIFEESARGQFVEHDDGPPAFELEPNNQPGWVCCLPSGIKWKIWVICPNWQKFIHIFWHWEILKICFLQPIPKGRVHYGGVSCYSCRAFFRWDKSFFFQTRKCLKNLWGVQIVIIMNKKPSPQRLISSCNNRFQLEMYFFFCFKVQTVNRITCCSRAKPTLDRLNLKFLQSFLSGCPGPKYWRSAGVWIFPGAI